MNNSPQCQLFACNTCDFGTLNAEDARQHQAATGHTLRSAPLPGGPPLSAAAAIATLLAERTTRSLREASGSSRSTGKDDYDA